VSFSVLVQASQGVYEPGIAQALTFADIVFNREASPVWTTTERSSS
jgi:hypothetical protein